MDQKGKQISINPSSLVGLNAELFRKKEELKQQKQTKATSFVKPTPSVKKPNIWSKSNSGVLHRAQSDLVEKSEENDVLDKSKSALEAKARLYEQMLKSDVVPDEDGSKHYLVDFEQKALEVNSAKRRDRLKEEEKERTIKEEEEEKRMLAEEIAPPNNPEEDWVDYVDTFGRSRKCLRKDLQYLKDVDNKMSGKMECKVEGGSDLMSADMRRELQRQEWEREAEEAMKGPVGPTHYANVQRNEVRDHGVGYFQFAKDEETREKQLDELNKFRNQTQEERAKIERIKKKRAEGMAERLAKVRQRKTVQDSAEVIDLDPMSMLESRSAESHSADVSSQSPSSSVTKEVQPIVRDESFRKTAPEREWDRGKKPVIHDERSWLENRREERPSQFAPPTALYDNHLRHFHGKSSGGGGRNTAAASSDFKHCEGREPPIVVSDNVEELVGAGIKSVRREQLTELNRDAANAHVTSQGQNHFSKIPLPEQQNEYVSEYSDSSLPRQQINNNFSKILLPGQQNENVSEYSDSSLPRQQFIKLSEYCSLNVEPSQTDNASHDSRDMGSYGNNFDHMMSYNSTFSGQAHYCNDYSSSITDSHTQSTCHDPNTGALWASYQNTGTPCSSDQNTGSGWASNQPLSNSGTITADYQPKTAQEFHNTNKILQYLPDICGEEITDDSGSNIESTAHNITSVSTDVTNTLISGDSSVGSHESGWIPLENPLSGGNNFKAPQPAHFSSGPSKPQPKKAKYEAIFLHELPPSLPAAPSAGSVPCYPSQEEILGPSRRSNQSRVVNESVAIKNWHKQFDNKSQRSVSNNTLGSNEWSGRYPAPSGVSQTGIPVSLKPRNIPFASPYIQSQIGTGKSAKESTPAENELSKLPPVTSSS